MKNYHTPHLDLIQNFSNKRAQNIEIIRSSNCTENGISKETCYNSICYNVKTVTKTITFNISMFNETYANECQIECQNNDDEEECQFWSLRYKYRFQAICWYKCLTDFQILGM